MIFCCCIEIPKFSLWQVKMWAMLDRKTQFQIHLYQSNKILLTEKIVVAYSLSILDPKVECRVWKINTGTRIVMKGKRRFTKLYALQGSTITSEATVRCPW